MNLLSLSLHLSCAPSSFVFAQILSDQWLFLCVTRRVARNKVEKVRTQRQRKREEAKQIRKETNERRGIWILSPSLPLSSHLMCVCFFPFIRFSLYTCSCWSVLMSTHLFFTFSLLPFDLNSPPSLVALLLLSLSLSVSVCMCVHRTQLKSSSHMRSLLLDASTSLSSTAHIERRERGEREKVVKEDEEEEGDERRKERIHLLHSA